MAAPVRRAAVVARAPERRKEHPRPVLGTGYPSGDLEQAGKRRALGGQGRLKLKALSGSARFRSAVLKWMSALASTRGKSISIW